MTVSSFHIKANASSKSPTKTREKMGKKREDARLFGDSQEIFMIQSLALPAFFL